MGRKGNRWRYSSNNKKQNMSGYVKINRSVLEHWIFKDAWKFRCWIDLISLANYTVVKIKIPGDPFITAGKTVQFNFPSLSSEKGLDKNYSGKYLVTAVRHLIQSQGIYQTVLELAKDSNPQYTTFTNNPLG